MYAVNADHFVHLDDPGVVVQAIVDLVGQCRGDRAARGLPAAQAVAITSFGYLHGAAPRADLTVDQRGATAIRMPTPRCASTRRLTRA
jgi:hypothetical protein